MRLEEMKFMKRSLTRQVKALDELLGLLENRVPLEMEDCLFCHERTRQVAGNLRRLRRTFRALELRKQAAARWNRYFDRRL